MLQVPYLRENKEAVIAGLAKRNNLDARERVDQIIALDDMRKSVQTELDSKLARANQIAREIGELFKSGKAVEANVLKEETATIKEESKNLEGKLAEAEEAIRQILYTIPNVPATAIPFGRGPEENVTVE